MRWVAIFGIATLVGVFFASRTYLLYNAYPDNQISWGRALLPSLVSWYVWALLAPAILWLAARFRFERPRRGLSLAVHLVAGLAFAVAHALLGQLVARAIPSLPEAELTRQFFVSRLHFNLLTYLAIVAGWNLVDTYRRERERDLRASQLEARLAEARLRALQMQLHPHFLFNTLHAISTLMHRDVEAADRMLARLSDLLRLTLENAGTQEVRLKEELDVLERYLEIERTRFGDRLTVELDVDPATLDARIPNLILQPLVENAVRHGVAPRAEPGWIGLRAVRRDGELLVTIEDDGPGLPAHADPAKPDVEARGTSSAANGGVGLANCRARLGQLYGDEARLELDAAPAGGLRVSLSIPFRADD
ncbi:MAG: histidine kinase [Gemmatimonadales bacterium]|jgi:K+-sensing histidine kinase KdpD